MRSKIWGHPLLKIFVLTLVGFHFIACASYFKRKECEKINWFEHGYKSALNAKRVNTDTTVQECKKAEAQIDWSQLDLGFKKGMREYCTPDGAYKTGKQGKPFDKDMCDIGGVDKIVAQYKKGLNAFCQPGPGKRFGAKGGIYLNTCPEKLETKFLKGYHSGRRIYLRGQIEDHEKELRNLDGKMRRQERRVRSSQIRLNTFPRKTETESLDTTNERDRLQRTLRNEKYQVQQLENRKDQVNSKIREFKQELRSLTE